MAQLRARTATRYLIVIAATAATTLAVGRTPLAAQQPPATAKNGAAVVSAAAPASAVADPLNLDFERAGLVAPGAPAGWFVGGNGYDVALDASAPKQGRYSLRVAPREGAGGGTGEANAFGVATTHIAGSAVAGKTVRLRGFIRTRDVRTGFAGLWARVDGPNNRVLAFDNMQDRGARGTTDWTAYEITLRADTMATALFFGALHPGDGTAWFDALSLEIDGRPYVPDPTTAWTPSKAELARVRADAVPLATTDPTAPLADLQPFGDAVGPARLVALGEGTHGTREFFTMKHRLTEYLATRKGFTVFAIEANMPEARRVNEYVLTGKGDPKALLAGLYFWTWNTQEVLDLIEWMRAYNASGKGRIEFWGFDAQYADVAMDSVRAFVARHDPSFRLALDSAYARIAAVQRERTANVRSGVALGVWRDAAAGVLAHLEEKRAAYAAAGVDTTDVAWAVQNARVVLQTAGALGGGTSRDSSMARNVEWIVAHHPPGTKVVLWAHNGHVNRNEGWMGAHLARRYGDSLFVVGFALGEGQYTAAGARGLTGYAAAPPPPGSVEAALHATGRPLLFIDLRRSAARPGGAWLDAPHEFRSIGAVPVDNAFSPAPVARHFDALVYVDRTTPSVTLPFLRGGP